MKKILIIPFLRLSFTCFSQTIEVRGKAFDSTKGRNQVTVILNDTLNRLKSTYTDWVHKFDQLWKNKNYVTQTDHDGCFQIRAKKTDSLFFQSYRHIRKSYSVNDLLKMNSIHIVLEPQVCIPYVSCDDTVGKHFVFIGEKIKVDYAKDIYYCNVIPFDSKFDAEYKVIENIYGDFPGDTIRFTVYDHYGRPRFEKNKIVLLYVSEYCDRLFHQKYMYSDIYRTKDGRWAGPYQPYDYSILKSDSSIKPEIIPFAEPVIMEIPTGADSEWIKNRYPEPYYKIEDGNAIAVYGNYVKELVELQKRTVLKARGVKLE